MPAIVNETLISDNCSFDDWYLLWWMVKKYFFTLHEVLLTPKEPLTTKQAANPRLLIPENNDRFAADGEIK